MAEGNEKSDVETDEDRPMIQQVKHSGLWEDDEQRRARYSVKILNKGGIKVKKEGDALEQRAVDNSKADSLAEGVLPGKVSSFPKHLH